MFSLASSVLRQEIGWEKCFWNDPCVSSGTFITCVGAAGKPTGYDRVRNTEIGNKEFELEVLEEAYTTEHWLVRIYKVKDLTNRGN